jgi:hypothetical protein
MTAEQLLRLVEGRVDRLGVGHLALDGAQSVRRIALAVGDDHVVATLDEGSGDRQADSTVAARDEDVPGGRGAGVGLRHRGSVGVRRRSRCRPER